jgi:hypothetical protein
MTPYEPHYKKFKRHWIGLNAEANGMSNRKIADFWDEAIEQVKGADPTGERHNLGLLNSTKLFEQYVLPSALKNINARQRTKEQTKQDIHEMCLVMMFERWGRKIIRPSVGLAKMLAATKCSLPLNTIKPPYPVTYIWTKGLGFEFTTLDPSNNSVFKKSDVEGIYISYENCIDTTTGKKAIRMIGGTVAEDGFDFTRSEIGFLADEETPACDFFFSKEQKQSFMEVETAMGATLEDAEKSFTQSIRMQSLVMNVFCYMSSPEGKTDTRVVSPKILRQYEKAKTWQEKAKLKAEIDLTCPSEDISIGQNITIPGNAVYAPSVSDEESERTVCTHWRRGHWRHVWLGPHDHPDRHREARWIRPVLINPGVSAEPQQVFFKLKEKSS